MKALFTDARRIEIEIESYLEQLSADGLAARENDAKLEKIFERLQQIRLDSETWENAQVLADNGVDAGVKLLERLEHAAGLGFTDLHIYDLYVNSLEWLESLRYRRDQIRPDDRIQQYSVQTPKTAESLPLNFWENWKTAKPQPTVRRSLMKRLPNGKRAYLNVLYAPFTLLDSPPPPPDNAIPSLGKLRTIPAFTPPPPLFPEFAQTAIEADKRITKFLPK